MPALSVLLPVRDGAATLRSCLRSLERQTFRDFEVVVVDDGSTDDTPCLLDAWTRRDARLRVLSTAPRGLVAALNLGLGQCRAPLVARMDADDAMLPRRLERQVALLRTRTELDVASCLVRCFPRHRVAGGFRHYEAWLNSLVDPADLHRERFVESPVAHPSVTFRKRAVVEAGGYRDARGQDGAQWAEDYDLWLRLFERGRRFAKVPEVLHLWRDGDLRLTRTDARYGRERFLACKAHYLAHGPLAHGPPFLVWGAGQTGRRLVKALAAEDRRPYAFVDIDPKKVGRAPYGVPVHGAGELERLLRPGTQVLVAVSRRGARQLIRTRLVAAGLVEGEDAHFAA